MCLFIVWFLLTSPRSLPPPQEASAKQNISGFPTAPRALMWLTFAWMACSVHEGCSQFYLQSSQTSSIPSTENLLGGPQVIALAWCGRKHLLRILDPWHKAQHSVLVLSECITATRSPGLLLPSVLAWGPALAWSTLLGFSTGSIDSSLDSTKLSADTDIP